MDSLSSTELSSWSLHAATLGFVMVAAGRVWMERRLSTQAPIPGVPSPPDRPHWLTGHLGQVLSKSLPQSMGLMSSHAGEKGRLGMYILQWPVLVMFNAQDARKILRAEHEHFMNAIIKKYFKQVFGTHNIFILNTQLWKKERAVVHKALASSDALRSAQPVMQQVVQALVQSIGQRIAQSPEECFQVQDVETIMKMVTLDVFSLVCFSYDLQSCATLQNSDVASSFSFMGGDFSRRLRSPGDPGNFFYWWPNAYNRQYRTAKQTLLHFLKDRLSERRTAISTMMDDDDATRHNEPKDVLDALLQSHREMKPTENGISVNDLLHDVLLSILFAGYDTTSIALTYALYLISRSKQVEQCCVDEINAMGLEGDLSERLVYCRAVVLETLRLYPPAFSTIRLLQKPVALHDGFVVPAGTNISLSIWGIHRSEHNFPRAAEFLPERWVAWNATKCCWQNRNQGEDDKNNTPGSKKSSVPAANPDFFLGFSAGARDCPGRHFALQEALIVLAHLLQSFSFTVSADYEIQPNRNGVVQHPGTPVPMTIRLRQ